MSPSKLSYHHQPGDHALLGVPIDVVFRDRVARFPSNDALVSIPRELRLSYSELNEEVQRAARGLLALGAAHGTRVGIWATDTPEWVILQMATARVGAILVNLNPAYRSAELAHALDLTKLEVLVLQRAFRSSHYATMVLELCPEALSAKPGELATERFPGLRELVLLDEEPPPGQAFRSWNAFLATGDAVDDEAIAKIQASLDADDVINIQFTSGTTGRPKAVMLSHHNILNNALSQAEVMDWGPEDRLCVPVPFYHCFGMVVSNLLCLTTGAAIVIPADHFDAGATLHAIASERCTAVHGVPTMFRAELEHPEFKSFDLFSLRTGIIAGAPCPPDLVRRIMDHMCPEILIGYGQTESSPISHSTRRDDGFLRRVQTVGTNLPHQEVKIVDPATGRIVPRGVDGEVCLRGYHVMRGYDQNPEATAAAIDPAGWLHSGDLGAMDDHGYLRITGRLKDMIIRGGENVYPAEVEVLLGEHPQIAELAVFGLPQDQLGEEVGAWVRPVEGAILDADELRNWAKDRMAHFKIPSRFWFVHAFPLTVTGKVQKFRIKELIATGRTEEFERP